MRSRYDREDIIPIVVMVVAVAVTAWLAWFFLFEDREVARAAAPFDHSNCQYPTRSSNPPNGCDNSDPAVPECVSPKVIDEQACIKEYVAAREQKEVSQPISTIETPPAASHAAENRPTSVNCTESK